MILIRLLRWGALWAVLALALGLVPGGAWAGKVALVIGNAAYQARPLENPVNDARAISRKLRALGFSVVTRENLRLREIGPTLRDFRSQIKPGDEVVVFYAGHGLQVNGINYLPAVDADIQGEEDVPLNSLNVSTLLTTLEDSKAGVKLLFLDACRDNPFARSFRSASGGDLGKVGSAPSGTLIHYATRPGSVAADGKKGGNGLYTEHLLKWMDTPNVSVETMLKKVALGVEQDSRGKQEPWSEGQLKGEFYFALQKSGAPAVAAPSLSAPVPAPASAPPAGDSAAEVAYWNSVKDSNSAAELQSYVSRYPNGVFIDLARNRVARLQAPPPQPQRAGPAQVETAGPANVQPAPAANEQGPKGKQPDPGLLIFKTILDQVIKNQ